MTAPFVFLTSQLSISRSPSSGAVVENSTSSTRALKKKEGAKKGVSVDICTFRVLPARFTCCSQLARPDDCDQDPVVNQTPSTPQRHRLGSSFFQPLENALTVFPILGKTLPAPFETPQFPSVSGLTIRMRCSINSLIFDSQNDTSR